MIARRLLGATLPALAGLALIPTIRAANSSFSGVGLDGVTRQLEDSRRPALYTGDFGDCLGGQSLLNVTGFDTALYYDNSTLSFRLDGTTNLQSESVMREQLRALLPLLC
jgi:hypothetical protein